MRHNVLAACKEGGKEGGKEGRGGKGGKEGYVPPDFARTSLSRLRYRQDSL
jgi:hypothetical protein